MAFYNAAKSWTLHCNSCRSVLASHDIAMIAIVPPSQHHLAIKPICEQTAARTLRKVDILEENSKRSNRSLFRLLCQNCDVKVGSVELVEGSELMCLKAEAVFLRDRFGVEKREKKLKNLIPELEKCGIEKVNVSSMFGGRREQVREPPAPVVYCDTSQLTRAEINSLTRQTPRDYQAELFKYAMQGNSLVSLPTGSGKTLVAAMAISCMKKLNSQKLAVVVVDRIPLAHQQAEYIKTQVLGLKVSVLTGDPQRPGEESCKKTNNVANKSDVLVLTHQIFLNMLSDEQGVVQLSDVCLLVIDEAHHCQGNHPFNQIMRDHYVKLVPDKLKPLVLSLTASPAGEIGQAQTMVSLQGLLQRLCCLPRIPMESQDLAMYTNEPEPIYKVIPLTPSQQRLESAIERYLKLIGSLLAPLHSNNPQFTTLSPQSCNYRGFIRQFTIKCHNDKNLSGYALCEFAMHLVGVLEINNVLGAKFAIDSLQECFELIENESTPVERQKKCILQSETSFDRFKDEVKEIKYSLAHQRQTSADEKFSFLVAALKEFAQQTQSDGTSRGIVFVSMRKTAHKFCEILHSYPDISDRLNPKPFVGHGEGGSDGMQWEGEQQTTLKQFRAGRTKLLISTNVLEEGLDVPICNMVIRFDGLSSLRAHVQSRGRASRRADSKFILVFNNSKEYSDALQVTIKERNMEQCMRILHNTSARHTTQAVRFACQSRKPPLCCQNPTERNPIAPSESVNRGSAVKCRSVKVSLHMSRVRDATPDHELRSAIMFFSHNFVVKAMTPVADNAENRLRVIHFELEYDENENSREEFVEDLTLSWCERGFIGNVVNRETWLEHSQSTTRQRTVEVNVLTTESLSLGYFRGRFSFCRQWPNPLLEELRVIHMVFQHDLRSLLILFTVHEHDLDTMLYEIEIKYNELASFILVDRGREYSNVFLSLKHPPKLYRSESGENWEALVADFDDTDSGINSDVEDDQDDDEFVDADSGINIDEDEQDDDEFVEDSNANENDGGGDADYDVQNDENIIHTSGDREASFSHPILESLDKISEWCRVPGTAFNQAVFGQCLTYVVRVSNTDLKDVIHSLQSYDKKIFFARVIMMEQRPMQQLSEVPIPQTLDQDVKYALQCLFSNYPSLLGRISTNFIPMLVDKPRNTAVGAIQKLGEAVEQDSFCQPDETLEAILQTPNLRPKSFSSNDVPSHCALVKRLIFTPTRRLFGPEEVIQNNRVLRNFNPSNFLCINIRDEDFSKISGSGADLTSVLDHLNRIFDEGIDACGDRYSFLGCSNSQLRSHSCWFVKSTANPDDIRRWMGDFSSIRCVGSYVSRMGQCFSTSLDAVGISIDQGTTWNEEFDVKSDNQYCFSDGIGRISQELADEVVKKIGKKFKPSAFQIRFAGYKGVLAVDPSLPGKTARFRPSMRKFRSSHRRLEVLATSRPQAVYLNHQVIMLLSNLGVPDEVFVKLMRDALDNIAGMLLDERKAVQQLQSCAKTGIAYHELSEAGIFLTVEPFFRSIIAAVYYDHLHGLLTKSRIKLDPTKARLMMGVMDETGVLQDGQVFVQYSEYSNDPKGRDDDFNKKKKHVLQGPVMVTRNPCLHPGDIRKLIAVDTPQLRHLVDCVVFPKVGPRPHANEMAGGDLDGDLYFVSWHQDLLGPENKELFTPMDYQSPPKEEKLDDVTPADMTKFLMDYIRSDQLGIIDNRHKAVADTEAQGIESKTCLLLAEAHSLAVDAPKTGCWPKLPRMTPMKKYPDFMMNADKPSYKSVKVLGKLFRACQALKRHTEKPSTDVKRRSVIDGSFADNDLKRPVIDRTFVVPGYEDFVESARCLYLEYCGGIEQIMSSYGIDSEAKLISGCFRKLHKRLSKERTEVSEIVAKLLEDLRMKFRKKFFQEFGMDDSRHKPEQLINGRIHQKAYACYYVAYAEQPGTYTTRFLSFPWIVDDVMTSIRQVKKRLNYDAFLNDVVLTYPKENDVTESLTKYIRDEKGTLLAEYKRRVSGKNQVARHIQVSRPNLQVTAFGSTATFLFREDSDIDLCVFYNHKLTLTKKEQLKLLRSLEPVLRQLFKKTRLVGRAKVPVIGCKKFKSSEVPRYSVDVPFDVSASSDGLIKATMVICYIMSNPPLLPVLRYLVTWANISGLTGHGKRMVANSNILVFMFLSHCVVQGHVMELSADIVQHFYQRGCRFDYLQEWENVLSRVEDTPCSLRGTSLGKVLIHFFASYNSLLEMRIPDSISKLMKARTFSELLSPSSITLLQEHCQRAYHVIALNGDLHSLLNISGAEMCHVIHLSTGLSNAMKGAERENAREMQERTGARVYIRVKGSSVTSHLIIEARGTELQVASVEQILQNMTRTTGALKAAFMSMCFVKGASQILFEGSRSDNDAVTLVPYQSNHHPQHDGTPLYTPMLATRNLPTQTNHVFACFKQKFITQFRLAARDHEQSLHGTMEFAVHFGRIYIFRVPKSFIEDPESVTVKMLQANLNRGCKATRTRSGRPKHDLAVTHSGVTRRPTRRPRKKQQKQQDPQKKKENKMKDKPCRSSYFTQIRKMESAERFLQSQCFIEVETWEDFDVIIRAENDDQFTVKFDGQLAFKELRFSPLRWCLTDVKRRWKENMTTRQVHHDGVESDVRFILQSRRSLSKREVHNTEYQVYMDVMQPVKHSAPGIAKRHKQEFDIKEELWNQVYMVRHKKTKRFQFLQSSSHKFTDSLFIDVTEVTEYSRPDCSWFRKVFTRQELDLKLEPPPFSDNDVFAEFLLYVWQLAFQISDSLSM